MEKQMVIANVVQRGGTVYVYDAGGRILTTVAVGGKPPDGLQGYTGSTFNVRMGSTIYTYDEAGRILTTVHA
jgi:hypothetical protein